MADAAPTTEAEGELPAIILGAGYAGLTVAREVERRSKGKIPVVLVDRNPVHVLRTQLYEIGKIAAAAGDARPWTVPLQKVLDRTGTSLRQGVVESIDLARRRVRLDSGEELPYAYLVIALGS